MSNVGDPFKFAEVVVADTDFSAPCRGIWVGTTGNVSVRMYGDGAVRIFQSVPAGTVLPVQATRVNASGTTASNMVAGW